VAEGEQPADDRPADVPCRCHEIGDDRVRFDTSTKIALPSSSLAFLLVPLPVLAAPALPREHFAMPISSQLDLPPPTSLLAQHCLLTIWIAAEARYDSRPLFAARVVAARRPCSAHTLFVQESIMRYFLIGLMSAGLASLAGCQSSSPARDNDNHTDHMGAAQPSSGSGRAPATATDAHTAVLTVHGMGCPQCANNVDSQLMKVPGVESVSIDMGSGKVLAKLSPSNHPTRDQLAKAIDQTGFTLVKIDMPR
jgi:copper chaperone CopZ